MSTDDSTEAPRVGRFTGLQVLGIAAAVLATAVVAMLLVVRFYLFPGEFEPVALNAKEQQVLDYKLHRLESFGATPGQPLEPEPYSEAGASREIILSEKELNALLANNTNLASRVAIDLSDELASARILIPMDPDFPVLGGRILRVNAGLKLAYARGRPIVALKGVSVMGVPVPNAWLGNLKNVDLVGEFGIERGFWKSFADGVENIKIADGRLKIELKE
ncbi:MAG: arginine N-succinyltransferase [Gammaproteobacteria bacterium]